MTPETKQKLLEIIRSNIYFEDIEVHEVLAVIAKAIEDRKKDDELEKTKNII
jgi:tellurite resistance protein